MKRKTFEMDVKAANDDAGTFEALVSVFGNVDLVGDRVMPGAFTKTLEKWRTSGLPIPVVWSHEWSDPFGHIGVADPQDVKETPDGLLVKGRLDLDDNPTARQIYKLMKRGSVTGFSFGYTVNDERVAKDGATELLDLDLVEAGPTLKGANPEAQLQAIKSAVQADVEQDRRAKDVTAEEPPAKPVAHDLWRKRQELALKTALGS